MTSSKNERNPGPTIEEINSTVTDRMNRMCIDEEELLRIAANQKIPVEVAVELYECKGSIKDKSFLDRIESYAK